MSKIIPLFKNGNTLSMIIAFVLISFFAVMFRMKGVELDYKINKRDKELRKVVLENKELKAKRARELSIESLNNLANKHKMKEPSQKQVIVVP